MIKIKLRFGKIIENFFNYVIIFIKVIKMIKILLVEDDKNIQRLLTLELRHKGYLVDSAYDGEQGMELFTKKLLWCYIAWFNVTQKIW